MAWALKFLSGDMGALLMRALGVLAVVLMVWVHGWSTGRAGEQRAHLKQELADARALAEAHQENQRHANRALTNYQTARAAIEAELARTRGKAREALNRPTLVCPETLGDAVVPGDLGRLLNAIDEAGEAGAPGQRTP
jgi:hypothetical protein